MENHIFWSEIGQGFREAGRIFPPKFTGSTGYPPTHPGGGGSVYEVQDQ